MERPNRRSRFAIAVAFVAAALLIFGPGLDAPLDFDDGPAIVDNATIRTLSPPWAPLHTPPLGTAVSGRPVVNLSFALNYAVNEWIGIKSGVVGDPPSSAVGFRVVNVLLHVATALLLLALVRRTLRFGTVPDDIAAKADSIALIVAGLWLIHPLQTEAVTYLSQRTELAVSLCYLAAMYAAVRHRQALTGMEPSAASSNGDSVRWFGVAVLSSVLGMASKEVMVTAPIVIALHDRAFFSTSWRDVFQMRQRRWLYATLVATIGITVGLDITNGRAGTAGLGLGMTPFQYLITQGWAIPRYLHLAFWPDALTYDYGQSPVMTVGAYIGLASVVALGVATIIAWRQQRWRWAGFLGAFFFLVLAPSSSIVPIRTEIAAERRMYLALATVIMFVVVMAVQSAAWMQVRRRWLRVAPLALLAASMLIAARQRSAMYQTPEALWMDAANKMPTNARAYDNVGAAMLREHPPRDDAADSLFVHAIALDSTFIEPWRRRASVAMKRARTDDAERFLLHVLSIEPNDSASVSMLGKVYLLAGKPEHAVPYLRRIANESADPSAFADLGNAFVMMGQLDSAAAALRVAMLKNPNSPDPPRLLGAALVEAGHGSEAVPYLERSLAVDPTSGVAYGLLSIAFGQAGRPDSAQLAATAAAARASGNAIVLILAGRGLQTAGRVDAAARYYAEAARLNPNDPEALTRWGIAEAVLGHTRDAIALLRRALQASPSYPPALQALQAMHTRSVVPP